MIAAQLTLDFDRTLADVTTEMRTPTASAGTGRALFALATWRGNS